jgi:hypothetical protein
MYYIINKNFIIKKDEKIIPILCIASINRFL